MEDTLGKRVAFYRRKLGLTQDRLAEFLGVTAQAVSKWENDQSCPDITLLPKLADTFGCTVDELLGVQKETVHEAELVPDPPKDSPKDSPDTDDTGPHGVLELQINPGKRTGICLAAWILLTGALLLVPCTEFWTLLWTSGLMIFGLAGLWPRFSVLRLGCALFGGYSLLSHLSLLPFSFGKELLLPVFLLLFGFSLLVDALRKPGKHRGGCHVNASRTNRFNLYEEGFLCSTSFGENHHRIDLPRLSSGSADASFGSLSIDLSGCEEIGANCALDLNCSFGELELLVPQIYQVVPDSDESFGNVEVVGAPIASPQGTISVKASVNFGQITLRYI